MELVSNRLWLVYVLPHDHGVAVIGTLKAPPAIPIANLDMRALPDAYAGGDFSAFDGFSKALGELH